MEQSQTNNDQTQKRKPDIMHFFGDYAYAEKELTDLLRSFEAENKTTSIFAVKDEQIEKVRQLIINKLIEENQNISQIPREFLEEHFLKFTPQQMQGLRDLAEKYAKENGTDDYRMYTPQQQLEGKLFVANAIQANLNEYLKTRDNKYPPLTDIVKKVEVLQQEAIKFDIFLNKQLSSISYIQNELKNKYQELINPFIHSNIHKILERQNAQILALNNEVSILKSINSNAMIRIAELNSKLKDSEEKGSSYKDIFRRLKTLLKMSD